LQVHVLCELTTQATSMAMGASMTTQGGFQVQLQLIFGAGGDDEASKPTPTEPPTLTSRLKQGRLKSPNPEAEARPGPTVAGVGARRRPDRLHPFTRHPAGTHCSARSSNITIPIFSMDHIAPGLRGRKRRRHRHAIAAQLARA